MKLTNIDSQELLPAFAAESKWLQVAFDSNLQASRIAAIDAPMTIESISALNDAELQYLYNENGIVEYYPDLSRETRDLMLYWSSRIQRYLGTPKAVEILCDYVFDNNPIQVIVHDNLAYDAGGHLIDSELYDTFDVEIIPQTLYIPVNATERIEDNIIRVSRNSQWLRSVYHTIETEIPMPVCVCGNNQDIDSVCFYENENICADASPFAQIIQDYMDGLHKDLVFGVVSQEAQIMVKTQAYNEISQPEIGYVDVTPQQQSIEIFFGLRYDNGDFAQRAFDSNDWWYSGILDATDEQTLRDFGLDVGIVPSGYAGAIGAVKYDSNYIFEPLGLYSGLRTGDLNADMSNFYCSTFAPSYDTIVTINNNISYNTPALTWKCRITKNS